MSSSLGSTTGHVVPIHKGAPDWLMQVEKVLLEKMSPPLKPQWSKQFFHALSPEISFDQLKHQWMIVLLRRMMHRLDYIEDPMIRRVVRTVLKLYKDGSSAYLFREVAWQAKVMSELPGEDAKMAELAWVTARAGASKTESSWAAWATQVALEMGWESEYDYFATELIRTLERSKDG